jgi:uncharacterized damage-inducible protein DinB
MKNKNVMQSLFEYKAWSNNELFSLILTIDRQTFDGIVYSATRVLNHAFVVDEIFRCNLQKIPHSYLATNTQETPDLQSLFLKVKELDSWYCSYVSNLSEELLHEKISFLFTDGETGLMTREEMLLHLITHGGYHRGQVGQIIRSASENPPRDIFTRFLHVCDPSRRQ